MNNKEHFYFINPRADASDAGLRVLALVQKLLDALLIPRKQYGDTPVIDKMSLARLVEFEIDPQEPAKWENLYCHEAFEVQNDVFSIVVVGAMPNACPTLCAYIEEYMLSWGWRVKVETEW